MCDSQTPLRPSSVRNCSSEMCDVHWKVLPWRTCTVACGSGFQSRRVECVHRQNKKTLPDQHCAWQRRPVTWQHCNVTSCGSGSFNFSSESPCYKPAWVSVQFERCLPLFDTIRAFMFNKGKYYRPEGEIYWLVPSLLKTCYLSVFLQVNTTSRENSLLFPGFSFLLSSVISGILSVQTSAFCSSLLCAET